MEATHKKLVSDILFEQVQKILANRTHKPKARVQSLNEHFILRGIALCPNCGKVLTGSFSQGRIKKYPYYHCHGGCHYRIRADIVNQRLSQFLSNLKTAPVYVDLRDKIVKSFFTEKVKKDLYKKNQTQGHISSLLDRSLNAQKLFLEGKNDYEDYLLIRDNCKVALNRDVKDLQELSEKNTQADFALLRNDVGQVFEKLDTIMKTRLLHLLFPEKVVLTAANFWNMLGGHAKIVYGLAKEPETISSITKKIGSKILRSFRLKSQTLLGL